MNQCHLETIREKPQTTNATVLLSSETVIKMINNLQETIKCCYGVLIKINKSCHICINISPNFAPKVLYLRHVIEYHKSRWSVDTIYSKYNSFNGNVPRK